MRSAKGDLSQEMPRKLLEFGKLFPDKHVGKIQEEGEGVFFAAIRQESPGFLNSSASSSGMVNMVAGIIY